MKELIQLIKEYHRTGIEAHIEMRKHFESSTEYLQKMREKLNNNDK